MSRIDAATTRLKSLYQHLCVTTVQFGIYSEILKILADGRACTSYIADRFKCENKEIMKSLKDMERHGVIMADRRMSNSTGWMLPPEDSQ